MARKAKPPEPYKVLETDKITGRKFCRRISLIPSKECDQCDGFFSALYEFGWTSSLNGKPDWDEKQFCSKSCREIYHG